MYDKAFAADPASVYDEMRLQGPVSRVEISPGVEAMLVTGYAEALQVLHAPEVYSKDSRRWLALSEGRVPADSPVIPMMGYRPNLLFADGAQHLRLRQAMTDSIAQIDQMELRSFVEDTAGFLIGRWSSGQVDLVAEFARALPLLVISRLFGCPAELGDRIVEGFSGIFDADSDSEAANEMLTQALFELVTLKRRRPGPDVTSWLMEHEGGLDDEEMIHQLVTVMAAASEPTGALIAGGLSVLLSDDEFSQSLFGGRGIGVEDAVQRVLWENPPLSNYAVHFPVSDTELSGVLLRKGEPVIISFAAANTDPKVSDGSRRSNNRAHLAWSAGPHACPGKDPALIIAVTAIEKLMNRVPDLELAVPVGELEWRPGPFSRSLAALPARFTPPRAPQPASGQLPRPVAPAPAAPVQPRQQRKGLWSSFVSWWKGGV